jgi:FkbM family methyltransferase
MKILYVTPHLSTGGMPEYLRRKVELMSQDHEVWVAEKTFEPAYRSIRDKIEAIIGKRLVNLGENRGRLLEMIDSIKPDVIHFEELSDYHFEPKLLDQIYRIDREYLIFDTLHDSSIDHTEKSYIPDKMLVVSPWQVKNFMELGIPVEMLEHEIVAGERDREGGLKRLGLDPSKKHIVQVGLFSKRKNQSETFQLARLMPDVEFHFVGNQTENYSDYWRPLLVDKPSNCTIWGERSDAETFFACMDCVIFPSRGQYGDRETNPLVIREAIAWNTPLFMRNLFFYMGMYSESDRVRFMKDSIHENARELRDFLKIEQTDMMNIKETSTEMDADFFKKKLFEIKFNDVENRIEFTYLENLPIEATICVRDLDTEISIYSFDANFFKGTTVWCVPIPKQYYDFGGNPNFGGFMYDFYIGGERKYTTATRIKPTAFQKRKMRIETTEPIFVNYEHFFTDKIYDSFLDGNKIDTVIDIGANVGLFTELVISKGAQKVLAAEFNQAAIEVFRDMHTGKKNVHLLPYAISDENKKIVMHIDPENSMVGSISKDHMDSLSQSVEVEAMGINSLFGTAKLQMEKVSLLKLDVEGAEYEIFDALSIENLKKVERIILEFHDNFGGRLRDSITNKLEEAGFVYGIYQDNCKDFASEWEQNGTIFASIKP